MQEAALAANTAHRDVILLSATGSGKTLGFLLPVLQLLNPALKTTQALVIVPSRELALQIEQVFKSMGTYLKVTCCYGGHLRETEENNLLQAPALIIGTPGRLADHIRRGNITTDTIETLVLDEFDKTMELGFHEELQFIISSLPSLKKHILTSATDTTDIPDFIKLENPEKLNFLSDTDHLSESLAIWSVQAGLKEKEEALFDLICYLGNRSTIVFCNHRDLVEDISAMLTDKGVTSVYYHGSMEQQERDAALCKFRNGSSNILITTDLASRGLDIPNIRYIIHFHLPENEQTFIHRNGRTARMEASGTAILLLGSDEKIPAFVQGKVEKKKMPAENIIPERPKWSTLFIGAGKKDKVNKIDIVGFFSNIGQLKKEDIGLIEVKDFFSFVAIKKIKVGNVIQLIKDQKIKNKKVKIEMAK